MTNYWAIAIGINQYRFIQPLMYAQWDAYYLQQYLHHYAQVPLNCCRLLTDNSAPISNHSTTPTRENIQHHIVELCQAQAAAEDVIWVFFSGYGVSDSGRDYLLPLDGDPRQPLATGIPISELFATLRTAPTSNIVVLLDMKQFSGGAASNLQLGHHTLTLAHEYQLPVILGCQPGQFSHETLALRQGLFTSTLLESIQNQRCITFEHLSQYLSDRLPQLSEQHWRPRQDPAVVIPAELRYQFILPAKPIATDDNLVKTRQPSEYPDQSTPDPFNPSEPDSEPSSSKSTSNSGQPGLVTEEEESLSSEKAEEDDFWKSLLKWGGLLLALLLTGVLVRNWTAFRGEPVPSGSNNAVSNSLEPNIGNANTNASAPNDTSTNSSTTENDRPLDFDGESSIQQPESPIVGAEQAIASGRTLAALDWLNQVPPNEQNEAYDNLLAEAEQLNNQVTQTNQAILNEALASMNQERLEMPVNQASDFHRAITQASRIQAGQPLFDEAQGYIRRWSQVILDLAESRARTGEYEDAIAAANLIPPEQPDLYNTAQGLVKEWQQAINQTSTSEDVIQQATETIQQGQASSYNEAIAQLRKIDTDQPGYEAIRSKINEWGQEILQIAYNRAEAGNLYEAINAAALVPEYSEASLEAREAIEGWRAELRGN